MPLFFVIFPLEVSCSLNARDAVRRPEAGLAPRFFGTLSGKLGSLFDTPGRRRPHSQRGAPPGIRTSALLFRRLASKPAGLPSLLFSAIQVFFFSGELLLYIYD